MSTNLHPRALRMLAVLLLSSLSSLCWADSLNLTTLKFSGVYCGLGSTSTNYRCFDENAKESNYAFMAEYGDFNHLYVYGYSGIQGTILTTGLNGNQITGTFSGFEDIVKGARDYQYAVTGSYLVNIGTQNTGTASVTISSAVPTGQSFATPEPESMVLGLTGLVGVVGAWRRRRNK